MAVEVQISCSVIQVHGKEQAHEAEVMIAMQVRNKNMMDAMNGAVVLHQLHLCAFSAIHQEKFVLDFDQLRRGKSSVGWYRTA